MHTQNEPQNPTSYPVVLMREERTEVEVVPKNIARASRGDKLISGCLCSSIFVGGLIAVVMWLVVGDPTGELEEPRGS